MEKQTASCNAWQIQGKYITLDFDAITNPEHPRCHVELRHERQLTSTREELLGILSEIEHEMGKIRADVQYACDCQPALLNGYLLSMLPKGGEDDG